MTQPAKDIEPGSKTADERLNSRSRRLSRVMAIAAFCWLIAVVGTVIGLSAYSNSPGDAGAPPAQWPKASQIPLDPEKPTLVFLAHPRCPCTRASLGELELLMARSQGLVRAHVLFVQPAGTPEAWAETDLWRYSETIPGVVTHRDDTGAETRRFGAETSGETLLYAPDGRLLFQGGMTISRGHSGDNPGRDALAALLRGETSVSLSTPVYGCRMFGASSQPGGARCQP